MKETLFEKLRSGAFTAHPPLDDFEEMVLESLLIGDQARTNKVVSAELGVSRNAVAGARREIARKIDIIEKPGF